MAKQISLMSHAPPIEESYLTHICLCNVCVSAPPPQKNWQKVAKNGNNGKSGKKRQKWQKGAIGKNW